LPMSAGDGQRIQHHAAEELRYVEPNYHMPLPQPVKTVRTEKIVVGERQRPWPTSLAWTRCVACDACACAPPLRLLTYRPHSAMSASLLQLACGAGLPCSNLAACRLQGRGGISRSASREQRS
jgi:hypothetical protein